MSVTQARLTPPLWLLRKSPAGRLPLDFGREVGLRAPGVGLVVDDDQPSSSR